MNGKRKPPQWLQKAGESTYNALSGITDPLYQWSQNTQVPQWLGNAGDAFYQNMSGLMPGQPEPRQPMADQIRMQMAQNNAPMRPRKRGMGKRPRQNMLAMQPMQQMPVDGT